MMNRPRPRKIVSVIKCSSPADAEINRELKPSDQFSLPDISQISGSGSASNSEKSSSNHMNVTPTNFNRASTAESSPGKTEFIISKPTISTAKKANAPPPPPSFSDPQKSNFAKVDNENFFEKSNDSDRNSLILKSDNNMNSVDQFYEKSSGEAFLDAADKAVDLIGGTFLVIFFSYICF
jgi:hypothetical protein